MTKNVGLQEYRRIKEEMFQILRETNVEIILEKRLIPKEFELYESYKKKLENDFFNIAILGEQGVGKSSLLNALLFKERILPIDVDETTNIITKIKYAPDQKPKSIIEFKTGEKKIGPPSSHFLKEYIHNEFNPKNEKGVREAIIEFDHPLLKEGVVFADTPGPGSLTPENFHQTYDFLPTISAAIIIFRTTPPLTESEMKDVIEKTWEFSQYYFFVQNVWGESEKDIKESLEYNRSILNKMKQEHKTKFPIRVFTVDINSALEGACNEDEKLIENSGIRNLTEELFSFLNRDVGKLRIISFFYFIDTRIRNLIENLNSQENNITESVNVDRLKFEEQIKQKRETINNIRIRSREINNEFRENISDLILDFYSAVDGELSRIGSETKLLIQRRKLNSKNIQKVFQEKIADEISPIVDRYKQKYQNTLKEFIASYSEIAEKLREITVIRGIDDNVIRNSQPVEIWAGMGKFLKYTGGIVTTFIGIEALTAGVSAYLATITTAAAPLAASAGAAAAIAVVPLWGWIAAGALLVVGATVHKVSKDKIISQLNEAVDKSIRDIKKDYKNNIHHVLKEKSNDIINSVSKSLDVEIEKNEMELDVLQKDFFMSKDKKEKRLEEIKEEKNILYKTLTELNSFADRNKLEEAYDSQTE